MTKDSPRWYAKGETLVPIIISLIALLFSGLTFFVSWNPTGEVGVIEPSGYAVVRGLPSEDASSDHLVFPLEWENDRGSTALVRKPLLTLTELQGGKPTGKEQAFQLVGRFPDISETSFSRPYVFGNSVIIEPHSVVSDVFVFAPQYWYDPEHPDHDFRFRAGTTYRADIAYYLGSDKQRGSEVLISRLVIYPSVDELNNVDEGGRFWNRYYIP